MNINKYKAILEVSKTGNITKAAKTLNYSQPNISYIITSFEAEIGFPVFFREKNKITLTPKGADIIPLISKLIDDYNELQHKIAATNDLIAGQITIGALSSMLISYIPELISTFTNTFPNVKIIIKELEHDMIYHNLLEGKIDLGFSDNLRKSNKTSLLDFISLFDMEMFVILNENHPLAKETVLTLSQVNSCKWVYCSDQCLSDSQFLVPENLRPVTSQYTTSDAAAIEMVSHNLGIHFLSEFQCKHLPENIVIKKIPDEEKRHMGILFKKNTSLTAIQNEMIKLAIDLSSKY